MSNASRILEAIEGAVIVSGFVEDENGLHICLADGRVLILVGEFAVGLYRNSHEKLH